MEKKLELRHLAAYLPYDLNIRIDHIYTGFTCKLVVSNNTTSFKNGVHIESAIDMAGKPILRPLSDLTKEIEHNEEKFVPIESITGRSQEDFYGNPKNPSITWWAYKDVERLLEFHFDIYGLIESGLAISYKDAGL